MAAEVFIQRFPVAAADIDELGHVNNIVYLRYAQDIAIAHWRSRAPAEMLDANVRVPALAIGRPAGETLARIQELAAQVGISHRLNHRIQDLSGGERQRTAICRALVNAPRLLLADEPTGSLDEKTGDAVFGLLKSLATKERITVILATHERRFAEACDRIVRVRDGRLVDV